MEPNGNSMEVPWKTDENLQKTMAFVWNPMESYGKQMEINGI
jgi:hypothetical protein